MRISFVSLFLYFPFSHLLTPPASNRKRCHFLRKTTSVHFLENESRFLAKSQFRKIEKQTSKKNGPRKAWTRTGGVLCSYELYGAELHSIRSRNCAVPIIKPVCGRQLPSPGRMSNRRFGSFMDHTRTVLESFFSRKAAFPRKNDLEEFY